MKKGLEISAEDLGKKLDPRGREITPMPEIGESLTPDVIARIKAELQSGNPRLVGGRPWWTSAFSLEELQKAELA